jgi:hypothetical protein
LPQALMNRLVACSCWRQQPRLAYFHNWNKPYHPLLIQPWLHHPFPWKRVQQCVDACC